MSKNFYIRADASPVIGTGHFVRCLNLARFLIERDSKVTFLSRNLGIDLTERLNAVNCQFINLPSHNSPSEQNPNDYGTWLGAEEYDDISQCLNLIGDSEVCCMIVDHYGVNEGWLALAKKACNKLIVLDDLAERRLDVDVVINQNLGWTTGDYAHLVGQETQLLLGPRYALLAENYATVRKKVDRTFKSEVPLRVLVSLGGADIENVSGKVARVLGRMQTGHDFVMTIVVGPMNPNFDDLNQICRNSAGKIEILQGANNLVDAYSSHDIAIGAVGGSSWERCCLGLPTILVPIAENQKSAAKKLDRAGAGILVDYGSDQFELELCDAFNQLSNLEFRRTVSQRAAGICDGEGTARLCNELLLLLNG
jgi:UDP-2,4-diacetamido-2,4,6-trideoxy-beta-L-altropyranose hydrolase